MLQKTRFLILTFFVSSLGQTVEVPDFYLDQTNIDQFQESSLAHLRAGDQIEIGRMRNIPLKAQVDQWKDPQRGQLTQAILLIGVKRPNEYDSEVYFRLKPEALNRSPVGVEAMHEPLPKVVHVNKRSLTIEGFDLAVKRTAKQLSNQTEVWIKIRVKDPEDKFTEVIMSLQGEYDQIQGEFGKVSFLAWRNSAGAEREQLRAKLLKEVLRAVSVRYFLKALDFLNNNSPRIKMDKARAGMTPEL